MLSYQNNQRRKFYRRGNYIYIGSVSASTFASSSVIWRHAACTLPVAQSTLKNFTPFFKFRCRSYFCRAAAAGLYGSFDVHVANLATIFIFVLTLAPALQLMKHPRVCSVSNVHRDRLFEQQISGKFRAQKLCGCNIAIATQTSEVQSQADQNNPLHSACAINTDS